MIRALLVSLSDFNTPSANDLHWIGGSSRLMIAWPKRSSSEPDAATNTRSHTSLHGFLLFYSRCYFALCNLFSVLTLYCTFLCLCTICKTVKCTAVFCIEILWRLFCCHHSLRWQGVVQCTVDVVCTVWEQGLIPGAQCKVDETQVLSLNRATWPDHLVSDQTVVILKQKQEQNFKNAKTHPYFTTGFCVGLEWVICISFTAASRLKKYSVMVNDHW